MNRNAQQALALLDEHGARLHALLLRLTLRYDVAEDLMQELFCKLAQGSPFATAKNPLAYAMRMATNLAFDYRRAGRRMPPETRANDDIAVVNVSPLVDLVRREELDRVLDAIGQLPAESRELVVLRYLEQHDYEAIARQFDKTPHQIRALCHKALVRLRDILGAERETRPKSEEPRP